MDALEQARKEALAAVAKKKEKNDGEVVDSTSSKKTVKKAKKSKKSKKKKDLDLGGLDPSAFGDLLPSDLGNILGKGADLKGLLKNLDPETIKKGVEAFGGADKVKEMAKSFNVQGAEGLGDIIKEL